MSALPVVRTWAAVSRTCLGTPNTRSRWAEARDDAGVRSRALGAVGAVGCAVAVGVFGELSTGALVAVGTAGAVVVALALGRRSGAGTPPVAVHSPAWVAVLVVVLTWEGVALTSGVLPTVSDLADPVLAEPVVRGLATLCWLAGGAWLVARPRPVVAAAMRTTPGRVAVLVGWLWLGVHFLAR
jgi:hypothetical protein